MKIKYTFLNGDVSEVEVSDEIAAVALECSRSEHAVNERQRVHCEYSLDDPDNRHKDIPFEDKSFDDVDSSDFALCREAMLRVLTPVQKRRFEKLEAGMSVTEIAASEGASYMSVRESLIAARKKLKNICKLFL